MTPHAIAAYVVGNGLLASFLGVWVWEPIRLAIRERPRLWVWRRVAMWLAINAAICAIAWRLVG